MKVRLVILALAVAGTSGCGSLRTVVASNQDIGRDLRLNQTYCSATTRVYSGVTYNFCRFHAEPQGGFINLLKSYGFFVDTLVLSPIADTVLLPVTIPQQIIYGNPQVD